MSNGIAIRTNAWQCVKCGEIYLSRIKSDLCCDDANCVEDEQ